MGKPHPVELSQRVVDFVAEGTRISSAASRFRVSVKFVNDMVKLKQATGGLAPKRQGDGGGHGKIFWLEVTWVARRIGQKRDFLVAELAAGIAATQGATVHRSSV